MDGLIQRVRSWDQLTVFVMFLYALVIAIVTWGVVVWITQDEPTAAIPAVATFEHPTGSLICGYYETGISCVPTWWLVPQWSNAQEARDLYGARDGKTD